MKIKRVIAGCSDEPSPFTRFVVSQQEKMYSS